MKTKTIIFTSLLLICATLLSSCGNKQMPMDKAIVFLNEQKFDLAIEQFNLVIEKDADSIMTVSNICFDKAIVLRTVGNNKEAEKLFNYAIKINQGASLPKNFLKYLNTFQNTDSVLNIVLNLIPSYSYDFVADLLINFNSTNNQIYPADCIGIYGYSTTDIWLNPFEKSKELNEKVFGISKFDPITSYILCNTSIDEINSISPKAFTMGINRDLMFLTERQTNNLTYSSIPELTDLINQLRLKDEIEIALERETIINKIIEIREKYLVANLKYMSTKFTIPGKCYVSKSNFDLNNEVLKLHLSLDYTENSQSTGIFITSVFVPLSLEEAKKFFSVKDEYFANINYIVKVGNGRACLGRAGGGNSRWEMPDFYICEEPVINIQTRDFTLNFKTEGLKGKLWHSGVETRCWEVHRIESPHSNFFIREEKGIRL